jgi:hypothetical protein
MNQLAILVERSAAATIRHQLPEYPERPYGSGRFAPMAVAWVRCSGAPKETFGLVGCMTGPKENGNLVQRVHRQGLTREPI